MVDYKVIVRRGDISGYVVECPALPGCVSQGATLNEAVTNIRDAIKGCLDVINTRTERVSARRHTRVLAVRL